jgi:hypothetical protein
MNPQARRIVVGTGEVSIAWWYEFVLYGGGGVGRPFGAFTRWRHFSWPMNARVQSFRLQAMAL